MARELTVDWPWPGEWESIEDVSAFYKDRLYPALSDYIGGLAESDIYIDYVAGPFTIANLTIGSVLFASTGGEVSQDNDDFFWDATNIRLGINVGTSPSVTLDVGGDCKFDGAVTINDAGADKDTRIEGLDDTELLFVDASTDRVGISTTAPTTTFNVAGDTDLDGSVIINEANADKDFRVEGSGATYTHLLFTDASTNRVGINENAPVCLTHIRGATCADYAGLNADTVLLLENDDNVAITLQAATTGSAYVEFCDDDYNPPAGRVAYDFANDWLEFVAKTNEVFYVKDGYVTTADGAELGVGNFGAPTNPLHVQDEGTVSGWGGAYGGVVARFRASEAKHTSICIDAQTGYDPVLGLSENGSAMWDIRNDASATDSFNIRYQVGAANRTDFTIDNSGNVEIISGKLSMDTAIATAIDIGNSFTGSQITLTGSSATDHAIEIDGVYSAALIYTHTSSATADTLLWGDMASTATSGDFNGLRPRLTCNAASADGLNARSVYGEVIVGASKYAALAQGVLAHVSYAAGSCTITDICALGAHISQGASLTATNLYGIRGTVQTRGNENISGNDYVMRLENEAVGGNGRQMDGAIQVVNTNMGGGTSGFGYGLDLSGADIATADIILQNGETIKNTTDGTITVSGNLVLPADGIVGVTDGNPQIVFDNTNNWLEVTGSVGIGTSTPVTPLEIPGSTTNSSAKFGAIEIQSYSINNCWFSDNLAYLGAWKYRGNGFGCTHYFINGDWTVRTAPSGSANDVAILTQRFIVSNTGNVGVGTGAAWGTNAVSVLRQDTGTAPTTSPADSFQMYSADIGAAAGKAGAHFRDEEGNIVSIGSGGMLMSGTARVTKEIILSSTYLERGSTAPDVKYDGNYISWEYDVGDDSTMTHIVPADWASGTDMVVKVHWYINEDYASDEEIKWQVDWAMCPHDESELIDAPTHSGTLTAISQNTPTNAKELTETTVGTITAANIAIGDELGIKLSRITQDGDAPTNHPRVVHLEVAYTADKLGQPT